MFGTAPKRLLSPTRLLEARFVWFQRKLGSRDAGSLPGRDIICPVMEMNGIKQVLLTGIIVLTLVSAAGCGRLVSGPNTIPTSTKPRDGMVATYRRLYPMNLQAGVKVYQINYWSDHAKVEALLTEPAKPGHFPLLVSLHGGWPMSHAHDNLGYTPTNAAFLASTSIVELYPEYQGYLGSSGPSHGIPTDVVNIQDAIQIAQQFGKVKTNDTYLLGYSLGGGLALMTAGWDRQVRAVVAVSPFVGMRNYVAWIERHPAVAQHDEIPGLVSSANLLQFQHGTNVRNRWYNQRSPNPHAIHAPVLLLQGEADHHVIWQTVQLFARQLKNAHRTVKLILYSEGHHGLHGQYSTASTQAIRLWFKRYGLNFTPGSQPLQ